MILLDRHGKPTAKVISRQRKDRTETVYNIEVQDFHTYHIGTLGVWVHNADCCKVRRHNSSAHKAQDNINEAENKSRVRPVNDRMPINYKYAGKVVPLEDLPIEIRNKYPHSVPFTGTGYPDFSRYAIKNVRITMGNSRQVDFMRADKAAGFNKQNPRPKGYTWHHNQESGYMQLVPTDLHRAIKHTGGVATSK